RLGARGYRALKGLDFIGIGPRHVPAKILEGVIELIDRATIELARGDELVAWTEQRMKRQHLRRVSRRNRKRRRAALQRCDTLFEHRVGRVTDAGVDVAERLQAK